MKHYFNIIKKSGKGNKSGSVYDITYQVNDHSQMYTVEMYCLGLDDNGKGRYCFLDGKQYPFIESKEDRDAFVEQIKEFQKGRCYRLTHPIALPTLKELRIQKQELHKQLEDILKKETFTSNIDNQIKIVTDAQKQEYIKEQRSKINNIKSDIESFIDTFAKELVGDGKFKLVPRSTYCGDQYFLLYNIEHNVYCKALTFNRNNLEIRDISDGELLEKSNL